ncbi:MAG: hypothetical protein ACK4ND_03225 [Cytophagaceae bacterium]
MKIFLSAGNLYFWRMKQVLSSIIIMFCLISCNQSENSGITSGDTLVHVNHEPMVKKITRSWPKDLPENDSEITSVGIGHFLIYKQLDSLSLSYLSTKDTLIEKSGLGWNGKVVFINDKEWLRAESFQATGYITRIFTNSPKFQTRSGIKVGSRLAKLLDEPTETIYMNGNYWVSLPGEGILVRPDKKSHPADTTVRISEIAIICGDC